MQHWKFLLFGITGDLSKRKVLPALAQFADLNKDKVTAELIGYSRSKPELEEINKILDENTEGKKHNLTNITDIQGEYSENAFLIDLINGLKENERLIIYLAVPPMIFAQLLENFCPFYKANIEIIIEKPFGSSSETAKELFAIVNKCHLETKAHFVDHFLFKTATFPISNLQTSDFNMEDLQEINIQALEKLDLEGRVGYYDGVGALQDYLPNHMVSLSKLALELIPEFNEEILDSFEVEDLVLGQYEAYELDLGEGKKSQTETYFKIRGKFNFNGKELPVTLETGKKLGFKNTEINLEFDNQKLTWNLDPKKFIEIGEERTDLNLNKKKDHVNMFEQVLDYKFDRFLTEKMIMTGWDFYNKVIEFKNKNGVRVEKYKDGIWPIELV